MYGAIVAAEPGPGTVEQEARTADDDRRLAALCAAGDTAAFEQLYRAYGDRMKSIAYNHLGNISDAEDAVQEAFLKVHRSASTYTGEASLSTWLYRIVVNACYDLLRKRARRPAEDAIDDSVEWVGGSVDDAKRLTLHKLLLKLPEQRRTVFTMFEIEGLTHAEIAGIVGITEANSKWILFSTKKQLQDEWKRLR